VKGVKAMNTVYEGPFEMEGDSVTAWSVSLVHVLGDVDPIRLRNEEGREMTGSAFTTCSCPNAADGETLKRKG